MRCVIERNMAAVGENAQPVTKDGFGLSGTPDWRDLGPLCPCYVSAGGTSKGISHKPERVIGLDELTGLLPIGTDVRRGDRLARVLDRMGAQLFGKLLVNSVYARKTHVELSLQEVK